MTSPSQNLPDSAALARVLTFWTFSLFLTVGLAVQWAGSVFGLWFCELFIFLGTSWTFLKSRGLSPWSFVGASRFRAEHLALGFALGATNLFAAVLPIQAVAIYLAPPEVARAFDSSRLLEGRSSFELWALLGSVALAAPFCEELFFRGVLQNLWARTRGVKPVAALVGSAVLFSALHLDPVGFAARLELGLLFGFLYLRTGSLWPGVFAHAANNAVSCGLYFAAKAIGEDSAQEPELKAALGLGLLAAVPFFALFRWTLSHDWGDSSRFSPSLDPEQAPRPWLQVAWPWLVAAALSVALFALARIARR